MQKIALPLVACLLLAVSAGASAQSFWKWRDAGGQMHMSDMPPPAGTPVKNIVQRPSSSPAPKDPTADAGAPAASTPNAAVSDLQKKKLKADKDKADADAADKASVDQKNAQIRADNCRSAQAQARTMQSGQRIAQINANGEREFLDDATIAARGRKAQDAVGQFCGPAAP